MQARRGRRTFLTPLVETLAAQGLEYVDVTRAFVDSTARGDAADWFMPGGHYSPAGNAIVARWMGRELLARSGPHAMGDRGVGATCPTEGSVAAR